MVPENSIHLYLQLLPLSFLCPLAKQRVVIGTVELIHRCIGAVVISRRSVSGSIKWLNVMYPQPSRKQSSKPYSFKGLFGCELHFNLPYKI